MKNNYTIGVLLREKSREEKREMKGNSVSYLGLLETSGTILIDDR